jgi:hypothetical protein
MMTKIILLLTMLNLLFVTQNNSSDEAMGRLLATDLERDTYSFIIRRLHNSTVQCLN